MRIIIEGRLFLYEGSTVEGNLGQWFFQNFSLWSTYDKICIQLDIYNKGLDNLVEKKFTISWQIQLEGGTILRVI